MFWRLGGSCHLQATCGATRWQISPMPWCATSYQRCSASTASMRANASSSTCSCAPLHAARRFALSRVHCRFSMAARAAARPPHHDAQHYQAAVRRCLHQLCLPRDTDAVECRGGEHLVCDEQHAHGLPRGTAPRWRVQGAAEFISTGRRVRDGGARNCCAVLQHRRAWTPPQSVHAAQRAPQQRICAEATFRTKESAISASQMSRTITTSSWTCVHKHCLADVGWCRGRAPRLQEARALRPHQVRASRSRSSALAGRLAILGS